MSDPVLPKVTLPQLIRRALSDPRSDTFVERVNGTWTPSSSQRVLERVLDLACAIRAAGLEQGDRVALIAHDCVDWIVCDFAVLFAGCVVVPVFPTQAVDLTDYIFKHSESKLLFVDTPATLERLRAANIPVPKAIIFDSAGDDSLAAFERRGRDLRAARPDLPGEYERALQPDDLAVLIYTSGTTGVPKGVMLSHDNIGFDAQSSLEYGFGLEHKGEDVLSVLPFSHIYEHTMVYIYLLEQVRYNICHDPNDLLVDMRDVRPRYMTSVPRIFDRILAGVQGQAMRNGGLQARLVPWALRVGREYMEARSNGGSNPVLAMQYAIAKRVVFDKLRRVLGLDRVEYLTSGSAKLHVDVAMTFLAMGVPIMQGYGLTETSPVITVSRPDKNEYGAVGRPIPGCEVKIAGDGEILARGRNIMHGYYRDPEGTAAVLDADGWFHTGDIGEIDGDGFLRITDRKKEVFKTATGKYISPARVEAALKRSVFVSQAMVIGDGRPHPAAIIIPNWDLVRVELNLPGITPGELAARTDVFDFITAEARKQTADLASYEQIRRIVVLPNEFTVDAGELSPSMKVKRRVVEERYRDAIERAYQVDLHSHAHA